LRGVFLGRLLEGTKREEERIEYGMADGVRCIYPGLSC
jgi:hypothetical protein